MKGLHKESWKKRQLIYQTWTAKNYGASQYIKRLPYIRNEDTNFQNKIIDIVNNRSDLRKFMLAMSDYPRGIQENINAVVADGKI